MFLNDFLLKLGKKNVAIAVIISSATVIIFYYFCVFKYSVNFPYCDDYPGVLEYLDIYKISHGFLAKVALIFSQHNEHRIVFNRLVAMTIHYLTGPVNFKAMIMIGNSGLIILLWILYKTAFSGKSVSIAYLLPLVLIIFNFSYYEICFWATASLNNIWVLVFGFASLYFLFKNSAFSFGISIILAITAVFTSGNGVIVFLTGALVLFLRKEFLTRKNLAWFVTMLIAFSAYSYHYSLSNHSNLSQSISVKNILLITQFIFAFLGNCYSQNLQIAFISGIVVAGFLAYATVRKLYTVNASLYAYMIFILGSAALTALGRYQMGVNTALSSRYAINSTMLFACCFVLIPVIYTSKIKLKTFLIFVVYIMLYNLNTCRKYLRYRIQAKKSFDFEYAKIAAGKLSDFSYGYPYSDKSIQQRILRETRTTGVFDFNFTDETILLNQIPDGTINDLEYKIEEFNSGSEAGILELKGWTLIRHKNPEDILVYIAIKDSVNNTVKLLIPQRTNRADIAQFYQNDKVNYIHSGFIASFERVNLQQGGYKLILIITDSQIKTEIDIHKYFKQ